VNGLNLDRLAAALREHSGNIMARWREGVRRLDSARGLDVPTLNDHMPLWIDQLAAAIEAISRVGPDKAAAEEIPTIHGLQRFEDGFDIAEVVAEYNILRDCVHQLAEELDIDVRGRGRRELDRQFDDAIAGAVKAFAESQAREVQRRRAEHLAFVAHDLRTPLSAITFCIHILERRLPAAANDAESARVLRTLARGAKQLDSLVSQVLTENTHLLTELGVKVERRTFDLWPMVESLMQDLQPLATKAATVLVNQVPDDLDVCADATLLRRVFQNLVANALGYTPGGEVSVGARDRPELGLVECWVADNGAGIPRERLEKVFEALETDPERDGLGLGLAIVKTFVEAHDGKVEVESVEGEGCMFRFTLPRAAVVVAVPAPATTAGATAPA
jgi:two-component system phosphate regulon sensor histidine kinase PhoR